MIAETKAQISKLIYHLSTDNRAQADKTLNSIVESKIKTRFENEYQKVKSSFSKEK